MKIIMAKKIILLIAGLFQLFIAGSMNAMNNDTTVIIPNVPAYMWYQNCALTCHTMIASFYAQSIPDIIPGNLPDNITNYRSLTDLLCYTGETDDQFVITETGYSNGLLDYLHAPEYGLEIPSRLHSLSFDTFDDYVKVINTYKVPVHVGWHDEPYGAHGTVGVGYQIKDGKNYLIIHDTWTDEKVYIDYEEHKNAIDKNLLVLTIDGPVKADRSDKEWNIKKELEVERKNLIINSFNDQKNIRCVVQQDINNDGRNELLMADFNYFANPKLSLYDADFTYNNKQVFNNQNQWNIFSTLYLKDLNDDNLLDLIATGYWCNTHLFKGIRNGFDSTAKIVKGEDMRGFLDIAFMNVDQDKELEIVMSSVIGGLCFAKSKGGLEYEIYDIWDFKSHLSKLKVVDLDLDGNLDLVTCLRSGTIMAFYYRNGKLETTPSFKPKGHGGIALAVGDIDKDGYPDIIGLNDRKIVVYKNHLGTFVDDPIVLDTPNATPVDLTLEDLTHDGFPELIVSNFNFRDFILGNNQGSIEGVLWRSKDNTPTFGSTLLNVGGDPCFAFYKGYGQELEIWKYTPITTGINNILDEDILRYQSSNKSVCINTSTPGECVITDWSGKLLIRQYIPQGNHSIDLSKYTSLGVIVVFQSEGTQKTLKIVL